MVAGSKLSDFLSLLHFYGPVKRCLWGRVSFLVVDQWRRSFSLRWNLKLPATTNASEALFFLESEGVGVASVVTLGRAWDRSRNTTATRRLCLFISIGEIRKCLPFFYGRYFYFSSLTDCCYKLWLFFSPRFICLSTGQKCWARWTPLKAIKEDG